jgi:predicted Abi (CAAX) family protease
MQKILRLVLILLFTIGLLGVPNLSIAKNPEPATTSTATSHNRWQGRLQLPTAAEIAADPHPDWAWIEITRSPQPTLIGQRHKLIRQQPAPVSQATTAIHFSAAAIASTAQGNIHPQRLNNRPHVSSLQSLAGARAQDNVEVQLESVTIGADGNLTIDREPIQTTGFTRRLVQLSSPTANQPELFPSQEYNPHTGQFNGATGIVRIPQATATKRGLYPSSIKDLNRSPAGKDGWYIYGSDGTAQKENQKSSEPFTVQALAPRSLFNLQVDQQVKEVSDYLSQQNWANLDRQKGQIIKVALGAQSAPALGQRALLVHNFGEISGETGDLPSIPLTIPGHFAYGLATVVQDDLTNQPRWDLVYNQVYAHNPDDIVAGRQDWATYMGHLQRGWMGTRPVVDALISYPPVTKDYDFDGVKFSPLDTLQQQLELSAARYRVGDGTGSASVTPATSCVQDSNQALYIAIEQLTRQVTSQIQAWLTAHPQDPQTQRFKQLQSLGQDLKSQLAPLGIVRSDWQANAHKLSGTSPLSNSSSPLLALMTWRTMLPRVSQEGIIKLFYQHGAQIQLLKTVQIGGVNSDIGPVAPTILFGEWPWLSIITIRLWAGLTTVPTGIWQSLALLGGYGLVSIVFGRATGFTTWESRALTVSDLQMSAWLFFSPALIEEILFRCLLLPHPIEGVSLTQAIVLFLGSTLLFLLYHPANALTFYPPGRPTFWDWRFLTLAGLLGLLCGLSYQLSGSLWLPVLMHWLVVSIWIIWGGGRYKLAPKLLSKSPRT